LGASFALPFSSLAGAPVVAPAEALDPEPTATAALSLGRPSLIIFF
jgi:hypothetical protein